VHILVLRDQMIIVNMNPLRTKKMSLTMMVHMLALKILMVITVVLDLVMTTIATLWAMKRFQMSTTMIVDECLGEMVSFPASQKLEQWSYLPIQERYSLIFSCYMHCYLSNVNSYGYA
jgi:hypothetical protein